MLNRGLVGGDGFSKGEDDAIGAFEWNLARLPLDRTELHGLRERLEFNLKMVKRFEMKSVKIQKHICTILSLSQLQ